MSVTAFANLINVSAVRKQYFCGFPKSAAVRALINVDTTYSRGGYEAANSCRPPYKAAQWTLHSTRYILFLTFANDLDAEVHMLVPQFSYVPVRD